MLRFAICTLGSFALIAACHATNDAKPEPDAAPSSVANVVAVGDAQVDAAPLPAAAVVVTVDAAAAVDAASVVDAAADASFPPTADDLRWQKKDAIAGLTASCAWAPPFHTPKQPEGAGAIEPRHGKDAASWDCEDEEFHQGCVYDPCADAADACLATCGKTCRSCAQSCIDDCGSCKESCTDDACRTACAAKTAACHEGCSESRHGCAATKCDPLPDKCTKRVTQGWAAHDCAKACPVYQSCRDACPKDGGSDDGPCTKECRHAFTSVCPGNGLDTICLINGGP